MASLLKHAPAAAGSNIMMMARRGYLGHILAGGLEKITELQVPDPFTTQPMCEVIKAVRILVNELGNRVFVMGRADQGPGALALALRGYERFVMDLAVNEQPELIHQVLDYCVKVQTRYALAFKEAGAHGTATGGLGLSLLSPRIYRQIEHPCERRFIQAVNAPFLLVHPNFPEE